MHEDVRSNPKTDRRFGKYKALWGAYGEFMCTLKKVKLAPQRYECAAPGCEVIRLRGKDLRRCGGSCPPKFKPSYCSRACQERDWQLHKAVCCNGEISHRRDDSKEVQDLCSKSSLGADIALHTFNTRTGYCPIILND
ncbi:hypothetical protein C8T65DRAFT_656739 [Cerioporus squamosus]|nr:hypothetical protein C8T65DRAFT_656739 [Cerioporus squamosus]